MGTVGWAAAESGTAPGARIAGVRKAAILLISLGAETSADLVRHLSEDDVRKVSAEIARIEAIPREQVERVLGEFHEKTSVADPGLAGGSDYARKLLVHAFGPEPAGRLITQVSSPNDGLESLQKADPSYLAGFIQHEHPQTIALILSHLDPPQAGSLLMALPEETRADVAARIATLDKISPEVISRISDVVGERLQAFRRSERKSSGGVRAMAEILNSLDLQVSDGILKAMSEGDAATAENVRNLMIVFEDLLMIDQEGIRALVAKVDRKVLTLALKGTSDDIRGRFTQCMSQRAAEMLGEDMDALGPVKLRDVKAAQQQILGVVRQLQSEGVLSVKGSEEYVV